MDVDAGELNVGPEPMTIDRFQEGEKGSDDEDQEGDFWLNALILQTQTDMWNTFCSKGSEMVFPVAGDSVDHFSTKWWKDCQSRHSF